MPTITDYENGEEIMAHPLSWQKQSQPSYLLNWQRQPSMQMMVRQKNRQKNLKVALSLFGVDDIGSTTAAALTGVTVDKNNVSVVSNSEDGGILWPLVFRAKKSNGKYKNTTGSIE